MRRVRVENDTAAANRHYNGLMRTLSIVALVLAHFGPVSLVQEPKRYSLAEVLGGAIPMTIAVDQARRDLKPVTIATVGSTGWAAPDMMTFAVMGNGDQEGLRKLRSALVVYTDGQVILVDGERYYAIYGATLEGNDLNAKSLGLRLVRVDAIASITPVAPESLNPRSASYPTSSLSRIKQAGLATMIYMSDYDDVMPYVQGTASVVGAVMPYAKNFDVFRSADPVGKFRFNMNLAGVNQAAIDSPSDTPLWYEELPNPDAPFAVAYADGHAKLLGAEDRPKFRAALAKKFARDRKIRPLPPKWLLDQVPTDLGGTKREQPGMTMTRIR